MIEGFLRDDGIPSVTQVPFANALIGIPACDFQKHGGYQNGDAKQHLYKDQHLFRLFLLPRLEILFVLFISLGLYVMVIVIILVAVLIDSVHFVVAAICIV